MKLPGELGNFQESYIVGQWSRWNVHRATPQWRTWYFTGAQCYITWLAENYLRAATYWPLNIWFALHEEESNRMQQKNSLHWCSWGKNLKTDRAVLNKSRTGLRMKCYRRSECMSTVRRTRSVVVGRFSSQCTALRAVSSVLTIWDTRFRLFRGCLLYVNSLFFSYIWPGSAVGMPLTLWIDWGQTIVKFYNFVRTLRSFRLLMLTHADDYALYVTCEFFGAIYTFFTSQVLTFIFRTALTPSFDLRRTWPGTPFTREQPPPKHHKTSCRPA